MLNVHSNGAREAFQHVVEVYHHAGLLYGCQVLPPDQHSRDIGESSRRDLFQHLRAIKVTELIAQDLTWPVFIAGTECQGSLQNQRLVQDRMEQIINLSGALERPKLLCFLEHLWSLQGQSASTSWIDLARTSAGRGEPILII